jgi:uncharacterized alkaline shock family protein YloU
MTGLNLKEINVHIVGVVPEKTPKIDTYELFDGEDKS